MLCILHGKMLTDESARRARFGIVRFRVRETEGPFTLQVLVFLVSQRDPVEICQTINKTLADLLY